MSLVVISDIHIKCRADYKEILQKVFAHEEVERASEVYLLGDIFDLMIGNHKEYYEEYDDFFNDIKTMLEKGKKVFFIEGNHDFHLKKLFKKFFFAGNFHYYSKGFFKEIDGKNYYFTHGDDLEIGNLSYQIYRMIIGSGPMRFVANYMMPYKLLEAFGRKASLKSSKRNQVRKKEAGSEDRIREKFRKGAGLFSKGKDLSFIIAGHDHVKDQYTIKKDLTYLNVGFPRKDRSFIVIENHTPRFVRFD